MSNGTGPLGLDQLVWIVFLDRQLDIPAETKVFADFDKNRAHIRPINRFFE